MSRIEDPCETVDADDFSRNHVPAVDNHCSESYDVLYVSVMSQAIDTIFEGGMVMRKMASMSIVVILWLSVFGQCAWADSSLVPTCWTEPVPVVEANTEYEEWAPFLSFDGLTLYFGRVRTPESYYGRIFEAIREEPSGPFTIVRRVIGPLNSASDHVLSPWVSPDNLRMYHGHQVGPTFMLEVSERASVGDSWPEGRGITELNKLCSRLTAPKLTPDELTIFFGAYSMLGGQGEYDIWMATRPDKCMPFDRVVNLKEINTPWNEVHPAISFDSLTLYFVSNRNGHEQLFRAIRKSLDAPFGNVEHLSFFDTAGGHSAQPCITSDGDTLYFVSHLDEDGSTRDIYVSYRIKGPDELIAEAIAEKREALRRIDTSIDRELQAIESLLDLYKSRGQSSLKRRDIMAAANRILKAIWSELQAVEKIESSVEQLEATLSLLTGESPSKQPVSPATESDRAVRQPRNE